MNRPKGTILFFAYYFPPLKAVACIRTWAISKYLSRLGWRIQVVTPRAEIWAEKDPGPLQEPDAASIECIRTGYDFPWFSPDTMASRKSPFGKVGRHIGWRLHARFGFEPMAGWFASAARAVTHFAPGDVDLVLCSGWPFGPFVLAKRTAERLRCPFALDYRDLWTSNPHLPHFNTRRNRSREMDLLNLASAVTTVSAHTARVLQTMCPVDRLHVLTNGYDPERLSRVTARQFSAPAVIYAGRLYPPLRTLEPVLQAMALLRAQFRSDLPFCLHYFGADGASAVARAGQLGLTPWLINHGNVSQQEALEAVAGAHVAVVVTSVLEKADDTQQGIVTGKVFEALGLGKRLLVIAPQESDVETIVGTNGRRFCACQTEEIARFLDHSTRSQTPTTELPPVQYSWPQLASRYDEILSYAAGRKSRVVGVGHDPVAEAACAIPGR